MKRLSIFLLAAAMTTAVSALTLQETSAPAQLSMNSVAEQQARPVATTLEQLPFVQQLDLDKQRRAEAWAQARTNKTARKLMLATAGNTVNDTLPNMTLDYRAAILGMIFVDANNADIKLEATVVGTSIDTSKVYTYAAYTIDANVILLKENVTLDPVAITLKFASSPEGDLSGDMVFVGSNGITYNLHLCWQVPAPTKEVNLAYDKRARANGFDGLLQLIGNNDQAQCAVAVQNWELDKDMTFGKEELLTDYTFLALYQNGDTVFPQIASVTGTITRRNDTLRMEAVMITFDCVQYNISLWYSVPQPKEVKDLGTIDAKFINEIENHGVYQIIGTTADGAYRVSVAPLTDEAIAGTYKNDGWFNSDFDSQYTFLGDNATQTALRVLKAEVEVTTVLETGAITATGSFVCEDENKYTFVLKGMYDVPHIPTDMQNTPVNAVFTAETHAVEIGDQYFESDGVVSVNVMGYETSDFLVLEFFADALDPTAILPEGTYEINDTYVPGTAPAGTYDGRYITPCFFGQVIEGGYIAPEWRYFLTSGTITVEKVGDTDLHIVVNALNSYDVPVKIDISTLATALDNVSGEAVKPTKTLRNGQLVIERNGIEYNALGAQIN